MKDRDAYNPQDSDLLPLKEQTYKIVSVQGSVKRFRGVVERNLQEDDVTAFIENYGKITNETLRKKTPHMPGKGNKYCKYTSDSSTVLIRRRQ